MFDKRSILIVDADAYLAGIYARRFEQGRWRVSVAESVEEGKRALDKKIHDAIIIDVETVDGSLAFVRELHGNPAYASMAIIVLTRLGDRESIEQAYAAGADSYLLKGHFVPSEVCLKVEQLVSQAEV